MAIDVVGIGQTPAGWVELVRFPVTMATPLKGLTQRVIDACHALGATGAVAQLQSRPAFWGHVIDFSSHIPSEADRHTGGRQP